MKRKTTKEIIEINGRKIKHNIYNKINLYYMKNRTILTESQLHRIIKESIFAILNEGKNDELINNVVNTVLNDDELLKKAYSCFSPRCLTFPKGTPKQQHKWRIEEFVTSNPEIFEGLMTFPLRKKAAEAVYNAIAQKYRL